MRGAAERGSGAAGTGASALIAPLLQNLVLSAGDNEELAYCLKAWQGLPAKVQQGSYPAKDEALKVGQPASRARERGCFQLPSTFHSPAHVDTLIAVPV